MSAELSLGARIRQARQFAGLSQQELATTLGTAREIISYWETDRRVPSVRQLQALAEFIGTPVHCLLTGKSGQGREHEHSLLYRDLGAGATRTRVGIRQWLAFLDDWADVREAGGDALGGRAIPPKASWRAALPVTDSRRAITLAREVREYFGLGTDAIPDLAAFLDQNGVLVYRAWLDQLEDGGISGAFYNHSRLGYCVLVNANTTPGRQVFTLAHEYGHALFHYQAKGMVSRSGDKDPKERVADVFAAHLLVPSDVLRRLVKSAGPGEVTPFEVIRLQRYFRVSYATMLNRLQAEGLLKGGAYETFKSHSPRELASRLGLDGVEYSPPSDPRGVTLGAYPGSVLEKVQHWLRDDELSTAAAADLLHVSQEEIQEELLAVPAPAEAEEAREFRELPVPRPPRNVIDGERPGWTG